MVELEAEFEDQLRRNVVDCILFDGRRDERDKDDAGDGGVIQDVPWRSTILCVVILVEGTSDISFQKNNADHNIMFFLTFLIYFSLDL